jgi:hypothetical protein
MAADVVSVLLFPNEDADEITPSLGCVYCPTLTVDVSEWAVDVCDSEHVSCEPAVGECEKGSLVTMVSGSCAANWRVNLVQICCDALGPSHRLSSLVSPPAKSGPGEDCVAPIVNVELPKIESARPAFARNSVILKVRSFPMPRVDAMWLVLNVVSVMLESPRESDEWLRLSSSTRVSSSPMPSATLSPRDVGRISMLPTHRIKIFCQTFPVLLHRKQCFLATTEATCIAYADHQGTVFRVKALCCHKVLSLHTLSRAGGRKLCLHVCCMAVVRLIFFCFSYLSSGDDCLDDPTEHKSCTNFAKAADLSSLDESRTATK